METEPTKKTEEDRWRELYPEIKKCVIVIARLRLNRANVKLKQVKDGERISVEGRRGRSGELSPDWMEPVELDDTDCEGRFRSFVKKLKVRVRGNYAAANGCRKPRGRPRGAGLLRLGRGQSCDVTADPVDITDPAHHRCNQSTRLMERWRLIRLNDKQIDIDISQSEANYNYSLHSKVPDTPDRPNGQSQDARPSSCCGRKDGGSCSCSTEKENPLSIVFKKEVKRRRRWRRRWARRKVKREPEDDSWTPPLAKVADEEAKQKTNQPERKQRRRACGRCAACLREDCGKCLYCLDKRKFGGPQKKKQRCQLRVCLVVESKFRPRPPQTNLTVTTATEPRHHKWKRGRDEVEVKAAKMRMRGRRWGGGRATPRRMKEQSGGGENSPSAQADSVLIRSTGLAHPLLLQPKEEEAAVEFTRRGAEGGLSEDGGRAEETAGRVEEDEECSEIVTESGTYYEVEVEVPGSESDEETLTASSTPSEVTGVPDDVTVSHPAYEPPDSLGLCSLLGGGAMDEVTCGRGLLLLLRALRRMVLPAHWVPVLTAGPLLQLLQCSKLSSMSNTIVHVQPDHCFYITVQSRLLPHTHTLYTTHTPRITHLSQLVSLLLELERLTVCRGLRVRSPTCHVLVAPPCLTCLPCLLQEEEEEEMKGRMD